MILQLRCVPPGGTEVCGVQLQMWSFPPWMGARKGYSVASYMEDEKADFNTAVKQMTGHRYYKGGRVVWNYKISKYE
jgi:hypothetical protein